MRLRNGAIFLSLSLAVTLIAMLSGSDPAPNAPTPAPARVEPTAPAERPAPRRAVEAPSEIATPAPPAPASQKIDYAAEISRRLPDQVALLEEWERRIALEQAADARFEEGLEASQVRARDVDARVRDAFTRVELEPNLVDDGLLDGLWIRSIEPGAPLAEAGFEPGDLLMRIDGQLLDDPAMLPLVFADAGPELSLCAVRGGQQICRDLILR